MHHVGLPISAQFYKMWKSPKFGLDFLPQSSCCRPRFEMKQHKPQLHLNSVSADVAWMIQYFIKKTSSSGDEIANVNCFTMTSCTYRLFRAQRWHVQFLVIWTFWCQVTNISQAFPVHKNFQLFSAVLVENGQTHFGDMSGFVQDLAKSGCTKVACHMLDT